MEVAEAKKALMSLASVSWEIQRDWSLGLVSSLLNVPKKRLRQVIKILEAPKIKEKNLKEGVTKIFRYGFYEFWISKKPKAKQRRILAPHFLVQETYNAIHHWLSGAYVPHEKAFGFVKGKHYKMAVEQLLDNKYFFGFDISNAFPSISAEMVKNALQSLNLNEPVAEILSWLVTCYYDYERRLPQGSSCSPALLNLIYLPMHREIDFLCKKHKISWICYADDFNFASKTEIPKKTKEELMKIPLKYGFALSREKIRDNKGRTIPHLLGLTIVDNKIQIRRERKKEYRRFFYLAGKCGKYSPGEVEGIAEAIRCIYGEIDDWPSCLRKPYQSWRQKQFEP